MSEDKLDSGANSGSAFSYKLHAEFRTPFQLGPRQGRGNSVVTRAMSRCLDSSPPVITMSAAAFTASNRPMNMALPLLVLQMRHRIHRKIKDGKKVANARITVLHNGVKIHDNVESRYHGAAAQFGAGLYP